MWRTDRSMTLNSKTTHFEFSGPIGAVTISLGLSALVEFFCFGCNEKGCTPNFAGIIEKFRSTTIFSWGVMGVYLTWVLTLMMLDIFVPGKTVRGTELRNGKHLMYKFNGTSVTAIIFGALAFRAFWTELKLPELQYIYDHLTELATSSLIVAYILSIYVYISSFVRDSKTNGEKLLALGGNTGNVVYDWFIGRELNPRWGPLDLKLFLEMRPGLLLWILIDLAMVHHQFLRFGQVSMSILLVTTFQAYYVIEGTFYESGLVSMIDTTTDGLGFMLIFGDIAFLPFTYTLQTRYLADHPVHLSWLAIAFIIGIYAGGITIFRLSNNEKNGFKAGDPAYSHLKYLTAKNGSKLLISGWWGTARHINYFGDWLSSWAHCLPCGSALLPYYFMVYFATLLIHRNERDEAKCAKKYSETWDEYKRKVPYKFIPYVY